MKKIQKYKVKLLSSRIVIVLIGLLAIGTFITIAYNGPAPKYVAENGANINVNEAPVVADEFGGTRIQAGSPNFSDGITINGISTRWKSGTISLGSYYATFINDTGRTIFVDYGEVYINGTASSTYTLDIATSSSATISATANPYAEIIDSYTIATSTANKLVNSEENQGTNGVSAIPVDAGEYVGILLTNTYAANNTCTGATCENATSTARGFVADYKIKYHFVE